MALFGEFAPFSPIPSAMFDFSYHGTLPPLDAPLRPIWQFPPLVRARGELYFSNGCPSCPHLHISFYEELVFFQPNLSQIAACMLRGRPKATIAQRIFIREAAIGRSEVYAFPNFWFFSFSCSFYGPLSCLSY